jgi:hypothetical protein
MNQGRSRRHTRVSIAAAAAMTLSLAGSVMGQGEGLLGLPGQAGRPRPSVTARASAPADLTGYWVALVTEDWRWRMITPAKGDYSSVPLSEEGKKAVEAWDPARDEAAGNQCKAYGAAGIMRVPGRLNITWENDETLRIDTDAGTQTRLLHFRGQPPESVEPQWQGNSAAEWSIIGADFGVAPRGGFLKVVTTNMRPGYLRKNGVPYSGGAVLTEYFSRLSDSNGDLYLIVTSVVNDPQYLAEPFTTSTHFKKIPDASGWRPTPCAAR